VLGLRGWGRNYRVESDVVNSGHGLGRGERGLGEGEGGDGGRSQRGKLDCLVLALQVA